MARVQFAHSANKSFVIRTTHKVSMSPAKQNFLQIKVMLRIEVSWQPVGD